MLEVTPEQMRTLCVGLNLQPIRLEWDEMCFVTIQSQDSVTDHRLTLHMGVMCNSKEYEKIATARGVAEPVKVVADVLANRNDDCPA